MSLNRAATQERTETENAATSGRLEGTFYILEKDEVDQLDGNKTPVLFGFAELGFLNSRSASNDFTGSGFATLTRL